MRVFGCARKIGSNGKLFPLTVKYAFWPCKSISVFILPSNHFRNSQTRKERKDLQMQWNGREREREKEERVGRVSSGPTPDAAARLSPKPRRSGEIESQPQTQRLDHTVEFVVPSSQFALFSFSFSTQSSSTSSLPISFSFSTQSSLAPLISSSQSHRTNDLIVSVSSSSLFPWSFRSLFLPPSLSLTKFVWSSMNCLDRKSVV